ncbi:MAG: endolytic transglycosylase MltG [Clostridiales bacterium]|nr:endolytic transglycosylase MltG [Clostridiales bacterium]
MANKFYKGKSKQSQNSGTDEPYYRGEVYFSNPPQAYHEAQKQPDVAKDSNFEKLKKQIRQKNKKLLALILAVVLTSAALSYVAISSINDVLALRRKDTVISVNIPEGANTNEIINILHDAGLIKQKTFCKVFMKFIGSVMEDSNPKYLGGVYYLNKNSGLESMLNEVKSVQTAAKTVKLVFPEGWSLYQIISKLDEYKVCKEDYLYTALKESGFNFTFVAEIETNEKRTQKLEGYLFPDTYDFFLNENANSVINRLLENFQAKWTDKYDDRAKELGLSIDEIINIASIIQKEAANSDQMALVSSVLHNRLNKVNVFPALECNATKDYITRFVRPVIGEAYAAGYYEAYNTYKAFGLPPGPICNPGLNAIEAALYPKETNYYYFQHDKNGKIYMARTFNEHNANTLEVLRVNNK